MSLSNFYKLNQGFKPDGMIGNKDPGSRVPVWGKSIVKDDISSLPDDHIPHDPNHNPTVTETQPSETSPVPEKSAPNGENGRHVEKIVEDTPEPVVDIEAIREEAYAMGVEVGRKQAEEEFENGARTLIAICRELDNLRETILLNSADEMRALVMDISEKIIRHSIRDQDETIRDTVLDAIKVAVKSDEFVIQVNPDDMEALEKHKKDIVNAVSGLENIVFQSDQSIERGGCRLESTCCTVDATISSQLKIIENAIMDGTTVLANNIVKS